MDKRLSAKVNLDLNPEWWTDKLEQKVKKRKELCHIMWLGRQNLEDRNWYIRANREAKRKFTKAEQEILNNKSE